MIKLADVLKEHIDSGRVRLSDYKFDGILKDKYSWLLEEVNEIEEGVSKTHGIQDSINQLQFHIHNVEFKEDRGKIICKLHRDVDTDLIQSILSFSYNLGYFPSYFTPKSNIFKPLEFSEHEIEQYIKNDDIYAIILDSMFDVSLNSFEVPKPTYHITQSIRKDRFKGI